MPMLLACAVTWPEGGGRAGDVRDKGVYSRPGNYRSLQCFGFIIAPEMSRQWAIAKIG